MSSLVSVTQDSKVPANYPGRLRRKGTLDTDQDLIEREEKRFNIYGRDVSKSKTRVEQAELTMRMLEKH
jgi:hypothetical protein